MITICSCIYLNSAYYYVIGVLNNFVFSMVDFWWLFHTIILFWKVWFPVHAKQFKYEKYLHIMIIIIALTFPILPIGAAFGTGGYVITTFPPLNNCFARNPAASFYPFILPKCIIFPTGITLTLLTIWKLSRTSLLHSNQVSKQLSHSFNHSWTIVKTVSIIMACL